MKVQELLDSEDKWTQKALARNKNEESVPYIETGAVKWCFLGAIFKCYTEEIFNIIYKIENIIGMSIEEFNDTHNYEEVMEIVRKLDI